MIKLIAFCIIILLTVYGPTELIRVITISWEYYGMLPELWVEIAFIWITYLIALALIWRVLWKLKIQ